MYKQDPNKARAAADPIIENTYRTLMTRGQKGCYVFCEDEETKEYFKRFIDYDAAENRWPTAAEKTLRKASRK